MGSFSIIFFILMILLIIIRVSKKVKPTSTPIPQDVRNLEEIFPDIFWDGTITEKADGAMVADTSSKPHIYLREGMMADTAFGQHPTAEFMPRREYKQEKMESMDTHKYSYHSTVKNLNLEDMIIYSVILEPKFKEL